MMIGIDTDNYDGAVSVERYRALKDQGVEFCIVGAQIGLDGKNYTREQIDNARAAGLKVPAVYELLYWDDRDLQRMQHAMSFGLPVFIDCEYQVSDRSPEWIVDRIMAAKVQLGDLYAGIYTGQWWWVPATRNSTVFARDPLWHAAYPLGAGVVPPAGYVPDFNRFMHYGGWEWPTVWQFADQAYGEPTFDLNAWNPAAQGAPVPSDEEDLTAEELGERRAKAELDIALLFKFRTQPRPGGKVELVDNNGAPLDPRIIIDVRR